jgi:hypothetical protein
VPQQIFNPNVNLTHRIPSSSQFAATFLLGYLPRRHGGDVREAHHHMSHHQWRDWVSPDIDYVEACPGLPPPPDAAP